MIVRRGESGEKVHAVQQALQRAGIVVDDDGDFGPKTEAAVKDFQGAHGLDVDGVVGPKTLTALGLDPDTLAVVGTAPEVINFSEEDVTVPPVVKARIQGYVTLLIDQRTKILVSLTNALANFETTMAFASAKDAQPDVLGAMASKAFDMAVDELVSKVPGASEASAMWDAASAELARAGKAAASLSIGNWIKDQRAAIDDLVQKVDRDALQSDAEERYLDVPIDQRQAYFDQLVKTIDGLQSAGTPNIDVNEETFYEQWINAHFQAIGDDAAGCVEYRLDYDSDAKSFDFESCTVQAPSGDKVGSALNHLLDRGRLVHDGRQITRPVDLLVRKRVCLYVDNFVGGKSWSCGWLDEANKIIHMPVHPPAQQGFQSMGWVSSTDRFKD